MDESQIAIEDNISRAVTYQDVIDAPKQMVAEIVDGVLYTNTRISLLQGSTQLAVLLTLQPRVNREIIGPREFVILRDIELELGKNIVIPDIVGWRVESLRQIDVDKPISLVPDWVCEVLSPSTRSLDLGRKQSVYARAGVAHSWLVDPDACTLEVFQLHGTDWELIESVSGDVSVSLPPFENINCDLSKFWFTRYKSEYKWLKNPIREPFLLDD